MSLLFRPCEFDMDHKAYADFLIHHHDQLNLPYSFASKLGFISSPLIFGKASLIFEEEAHRIIGAIGFVYGTGADHYEDRQVCQIETVFLLKEYRSSMLFPELLRRTLQLIHDGEPNVQTIQFWVDARQAEMTEMFSKLLKLSGSQMQSADNGLALYRIPFIELERYCQAYTARRAVKP